MLGTPEQNGEWDRTGCASGDRSMMSLAHIAHDKARVSQHEKQATCHGKKFPALRENTTDAGFESARNEADQQIQNE